MSPFRILGLPHDADEPAIKRAYARLLKQHRPDEDPAGFQRINEAFQACIARARYAASVGGDVDFDEDDDEDQVDADVSGDREVDESTKAIGDTREPARDYFPADGVGYRLSADALDELLAKPALATGDDERPEPTPADEPVEPAEAIATPPDAADTRETISFDLGAFVDELLRRDSEGQAAVRAWLVGHEALYSLELKEALVAPLVQHLLQRQVRMSADGLAVVLDFFHLDTVHNGHPWLTNAVESLRYNSLAAAHFDALVAAHTKGAKSPPRGPGHQSTPIDRLMLRELLGPANGLRRAFLTLVPLLPTRVIGLLARLREADTDYANARIDLASVAWWESITDLRRIGLRRLLLAIVRILPVSALVAWVMRVPGSSDEVWQIFASSAAWFGGMWLVYALVTMARLRAGDWQLRHPSVHLRSLACLALVAIAVAAGLGIDPAMSLYFFIASAWLLLVNPPMQGRSLVLISLLTGTASFMLLAATAGLMPAHFGESLVASLAASFVVNLANDYFYAKANALSLPQARREHGWIARVIVSNVIIGALLVAAMVILESHPA